MNYMKKQKRYVCGGSIFIVLLLVSFMVNTIMFNNKLNTIGMSYISDNNQQLAEHIAFRLRTNTELITDFADMLSRIPDFRKTEDLLKRKAKAFDIEGMMIISADGKKELSSGEAINLEQWIMENEEIWKEPQCFFFEKQYLVFSAPVIEDGKTEKIVLGLQSYKEIHSMIKQTDNWKFGIRVLANRKNGEILMMEKGESSFVSEEEIPVILEKIKENEYRDTMVYNDRLVSSVQVEGTDWEQVSVIRQATLRSSMSKYIRVYLLLILAEFFVLILALYGFRKDIKKKSEFFMRDSLTGGYNREGFLRMSQKYKERNEDTQYAVACLNICDFRRINEIWGEDNGNKLIVFVYRMLKNRIRENELVCRSSMDRFLLLLNEETEEKIAGRITEMISCINEKIHEKFCEYHMNFSIGCCQLSIEENIERAIGKGIYVRKQNSEKNVCTFYNDEVAQKITATQEINELFEESLKNHDFKIYLQPKVSEDDICQAEALVRWLHPKKGMIYPDMFIPIFERNGKIYNLDVYVFEEVCRIVAQWMEQGKEIIEISVNISRFTLLTARKDIWEEYRQIKEKYGIPDGIIEIELTETVLMDEKQIAYIQKLLQGFHSCGLKVALDDFGFAYSSLSLLKAFDVDTIKLDKGFFIDENQKSRKIVANIIQLAHSLGMCVVAEGIEEQEQVDMLQESGCDFIQGYVYSKPLPLEKFDIWKKEYKEQRKSRLD